MKKIVILLAVFLCIEGANVGYAQKAVWKRLAGEANTKPAQKTAFNRAKMLSAKQLQKTLHKRVLKSQENVYQYSLEELSLFLQDVELPLVSFVDYPSEIFNLFYEQKPWLQNAPIQVQRDYFISHNNRLTHAVIKKRHQTRVALHARMTDVLHKRVPFTSDDVIAQTARNISPQVKQILIGEEHNKPAVSASILQFIKEVRARNPHRQIICFSEFILQNASVENIAKRKALNPIEQGYFDIYNWLGRNQVKVVGLEPEQVKQYQTVSQWHSDGYMHFEKHYIWETLWGMQWRNQQWLNVLQKYRQKYPDALFIVHAGSGHTGYTQPFTLATHFNPQETFVVHFEKKRSNDRYRRLLATVDDSNVAALGWTDKEINRLIGFDVLITLD